MIISSTIIVKLWAHLSKKDHFLVVPCVQYTICWVRHEFVQHRAPLCAFSALLWFSGTEWPKTIGNLYAFTYESSTNILFTQQWDASIVCTNAHTWEVSAHTNKKRMQFTHKKKKENKKEHVLQQIYNQQTNKRHVISVQFLSLSLGFSVPCYAPNICSTIFAGNTSNIITNPGIPPTDSHVSRST